MPPIKPSELKRDIPDKVFDCVNALLAKKHNSDIRTILYQEELVAALVEAGYTRSEIFANGYLDFEKAYRDAGWNVRYERGFLNEESFFEFTPKNS